MLIGSPPCAVVLIRLFHRGAGSGIVAIAEASWMMILSVGSLLSQGVNWASMAYGTGAPGMERCLRSRIE